MRDRKISRNRPKPGAGHHRPAKAGDDGSTRHSGRFDTRKPVARDGRDDQRADRRSTHSSGKPTNKSPGKSFGRASDRDRSTGKPTGKPPHVAAGASQFKPAFKTRPRPKPETAGRPVQTAGPAEPMRIAKAMARAGLCSRREAERWITEGRVRVNGTILTTPALDVGPRHKIVVDGEPLPAPEPVRLWRYHKPRGLVTTHADPEGRPTVFDKLPEDLPRVISIGRLDVNTEGLLLLTNDGELARYLELPETGWLRRYRVRARGRVMQADLDKLKDGVEIEGVSYGPVEATLDSFQGANSWLTLGLREGKNREVRKILGSLGLEVGRLIRISFGPFQLLDLAEGDAELVKRRVLADQLGPKLAEDFGLLGELIPVKPQRQKPPQQGGRPQDPQDRKEQSRGAPRPKRGKVRDDDIETQADRAARWRPGPPSLTRIKERADGGRTNRSANRTGGPKKPGQRPGKPRPGRG